MLWFTPQRAMTAKAREARNPKLYLGFPRGCQGPKYLRLLLLLFQALQQGAGLEASVGPSVTSSPEAAQPQHQARPCVDTAA